jgi:hypothetical protein
MANDDWIWSDEEAAEEALARELRDLRPYLLRQQRAETVRPDPAFARSLRARLVDAQEPEPLRDRLRRVIATLLPPPAPRLALAGVRSAASAAQPSTYAAENVQISLSSTRPSRDSASYTLRGMVMSAAHTGEALAQARAELARAEEVQGSAALDEFGTFTITDVPAGEYSLQVSFPDVLVVIPALTLGE